MPEVLFPGNRLSEAAFALSQGARLIRADRAGWVFETPKALGDWELEFANSGAAAFDNARVRLKNLRKT